MDLSMAFPPQLLPNVPCIILSHVPCDDAGNGLTHGLCRLPRIALEFDAHWINDIVP